MFSRNLPEKRKEARIYLKIPMQCEILSPENKPVRNKSVSLNNINACGAYFETNEVVPLATNMNVEFSLPHSSRIIKGLMQVVRLEVVSENIFGIGALFVNLTEQDKGDIIQFMDKSNISKLFELVVKYDASDLHLLGEQPPILRIGGELKALDMPKIHSYEIPNLIYSVMTKEQIHIFEREKELDFGIQHDSANRFRINLHQQRGFLEVAFRRINASIPSFEELNEPEVMKDLTRLTEGLILITGPTNSGKSTTMAAMVELINQERKVVVITLERPIEYVHENAKSIIKQREIGVDTQSFSIALKSSLRQDPNVIVIGELDDTETIKTALIAAEAGFLVIASFHAPNTIQGIERFVNMFPAEIRKQVLAQLANCFKGIICQLLVTRKDKKGRILASEVLTSTDAVKRVIRNDELIQLATLIQTGSAYKMQTMFDSLKKLARSGLIEEETATLYSAQFQTTNR